MASTTSSDLVGRPLVPFFDAEENVNATLEVDPMTHLYEQGVDVDARVWDKSLGYFVYPTEKPTPSLASSTIRAPSAPIAIQNPILKSPAVRANSGMLLTPDFLLSRSAPNPSSTSSSFMTMSVSSPVDTTAVAVARAQIRPSPSSTVDIESKGMNQTPQNSSTQRGSTSTRPKSRSNTPNRSKPQSICDTTSSSSSTKKKRSSNKENSSSSSSSSSKPKEELSTNGKWAWSAFQNSPDPKSLPLPPPFTSPGLGPTTEMALVVSVPLQLPPPPRVPPDTAAVGEEEERCDLVSIEHSMTQDLRRMLNIGGG